ncbi:hypothetical protein B0H17DRAFT_1209270 [Mycena rosella]|uniref:Uncharacterized protein n=1 Tax=Mycena rosella TaxID=1033263 RepID=A0AAD7D079_MYCRO|nr:hypothetical protein B0H17DRAFT_1209270 [Mycena rosella]
MAQDITSRKIVTDGAAKLIEDNAHRLSHSSDNLPHCRAQKSYPQVSRGVSRGGGQTEPGELQNNPANTAVTDELLAHEYFGHLSRFANLLFWIFGPLLFAFYSVQMGMLATHYPGLSWNFAGTVFAVCTFNFGPRAITVPHLDFGNLSWGWCTITALGKFNPNLGGHLILWDLKLVI